MYTFLKHIENLLRSVRTGLDMKRETLRDRTVSNVYYMLQDYSDWYQEAGLVLPPDFETDPSGWNEELHKMTRAFKLVHDEMNKRGELWDAKHKWDGLHEVDLKKIEALTKEVQEGFEAFGKQLQYLTDPEGEYPERH